MFGLSFWEIGTILIVALLVLGPKRLPQAARSIGAMMRSLRRMSSDVRSAIDEPLREIREPLQEMRDDLYHTVRHFEEQMVEEADDQSAVNCSDTSSDEAGQADAAKMLPPAMPNSSATNTVSTEDPLEDHSGDILITQDVSDKGSRSHD